MCPKKVAIVSLDEDFAADWVVGAIVPAHRLSRSVKRENNWLTHHHHGLDYLNGDLTGRCVLFSRKHEKFKLGVKKNGEF